MFQLQEVSAFFLTRAREEFGLTLSRLSQTAHRKLTTLPCDQAMIDLLGNARQI